MEKIVDLHIHTNRSDGSLSPQQVIDEAIKKGVSVISIADHDTIEAYTDDFFEYARQRNVQVIPAVEISTKTGKAGVHVLGYNFDFNNQKMRDKLYSLRNARHNYLFNVAAKLEELGYVIHTSELDKIDAVTKAHISLDVISSPDNSMLLLKEFGHIPDKGEFIETVMNEGCPAYIAKETIAPKEAAELIRQAGGKVILAHPVAYKYEDGLQDEDILSLVLDMNADGIEANYIYIDKHHNKINEVEHWNEFAMKHNLNITIGSDFHNEDGLHPIIGLVNEEIKLTEKEINSILKNLIG